MRAQLIDLGCREAAALEQHGCGREIARGDEKAVRQTFRIELARGRRHRGVELEHRFRRLLLVPQRHGEDAAVLERAHIAEHRLARIGEFLHDREAAGVRQAGGIGEAQIDDVVAVAGIGEVEPAVIVDDADLRIVENVAGEIAQSLVGAERVEHRRIAFRHRHRIGARAQRDRGRDAAAELHHERVGPLLDQVRIDHRQKAEIDSLLRRQIADDADRAVAVDVHAEIGVRRHFRQVERGVVGKPRREMQV